MGKECGVELWNCWLKQSLFQHLLYTVARRLYELCLDDKLAAG